MEKSKIIEAKKEAQRFIEKVNKLLNKYELNNYPHPKESGAVRRASMDLTRALAEMRKPQSY